MKTLNIRLLVILLAGSAVLGAGVYALRWWQVRRNAGVFLRQARSALEEAEAITGTESDDVDRKKTKLQNAVRNYTWFVRMRPNDIEALEELGER